ncbi:MAG: MFS transporter [Alicyclobacillus sp.]|nr:MFS transporter [Alicyclobacillus sp.]MCL6516039.1 MFS transporter [Alicyclobacillus sp.]
MLFTLALGMLLNPLNSSMISVAIARFQDLYHLSFEQVSWIISTYYLASGIGQPVMGKLADLAGARRMFLIGLFVVAVSCSLAPFSPSFAWLIAFRILQALGTSAIYPSGMAIVRRTVTDGQARALAFLAVFSSGSAAFGPTVGGLLLHWRDWPALFLVNFPFLIAAFALGLAILPGRNRQPGGATETERAVETAPAGTPHQAADLIRAIDPVGAALFGIGIVGILMFLLSFRTGIRWGAGGVGVAALALMTIWELKVERPFIHLRVFARNPTFTWVHVQFVVVNVIFYSIFFGIPTYLQEVRHFDARTTGFLMLALAGFGVVISPLAGRWIDRSGSRPALVTAGGVMLIGSLLLTTLHATSPMGWLVVVFSVLGLSNGFNNVGLQAALFESAPPEIIGAASGLFMTARYLGTIGSSALLGLVFGATPTTGRLRLLGGLLAVLALAVLWMSLRLPRRGDGRR